MSPATCRCSGCCATSSASPARSSAAAWRCVEPAPCSWTAGRSAPVSRPLPRLAVSRSRPSRASARRQAARRCSRRGSIWTWCSAATANRARSWRPPPCSPASRTLRTPTSTRRWLGTSVAVVPTCVSAPRSNGRDADHMTPALSRRAFLEVGAAIGGGLLLGFTLPGRTQGRADRFATNAFIRIDHDGRVTLMMHKVEMGQGTYTSMPMLLAEELEVDLAQVRLEHAPPDDALYAEPLFGVQETGGSTSVRGNFEPLRRAGAAARTLLVAAASQAWKVTATSCRAKRGEVVHAPTGRRLGYGALVDRAATLPVPRDPPLKDAKDWTLIGTPAKRLDSPDKVNGAAQFGIDVRLPGMKVATLAACPVFGGTLASVDDTKARAVPGVRQVVRLEDGVAVVADHMWASKQGLAALDIKWDEGPNAKLGTADIVQQLAAASQRPGVVARNDGDAVRAMAGAARKVEAIYELPFLAHATMEPVNCTVHVRRDSCDIWVGTQVPTFTRTAAAQLTGLPRERVQVHNHLLGGGFGRRLEVDFVRRAVRIAMQVPGPVKVVWTREEDIQHDMYRPYYYDRIAAGLDERGRPVAWTHRVTGSSIMARVTSELFPKTLRVMRAVGLHQLIATVKGLDVDAVEGAAEPPYTSRPLTVAISWWRPTALMTRSVLGNSSLVTRAMIDEPVTRWVQATGRPRSSRPAAMRS